MNRAIALPPAAAVSFVQALARQLNPDHDWGQPITE